MTSDNIIKVGITLGDTNGVGPEVVCKVLEDERLLELCAPVIYGSPRMLSAHIKAMELPPVRFVKRDSADEAESGEVTLISCGADDLRPEFGKATAEAGRQAFDALECATADLDAGDIDVLVTAPINKQSIQNENFNFAGHTEYLQSKAPEGSNALMVLTAGDLRVALVTGHMPVARISETLTKELVKSRLAEFNEVLRSDFGIVRPRIAVLSLNPHSGDNGLLGSEETDIIRPAIDEATAERIMAFGPYPADGFFGAGQHKVFDGILAMYHDQGLTPFKTLAMDAGVNYTAGLPWVRTSPDHGTGYDIAGKGTASPESMRQAIYTAIDIYRNRARHSEMTANPLRKHYHEKSRTDRNAADIAD